MFLEKYKDVVVGIVGPIDLGLLRLQNNWNKIPSGNEYPIFSYYANYLIDNGIKVVIFTSAPNIVQSENYIDENIEVFVAPKSSLIGRDMRSIHTLIVKRPVDILFAQWTYEFAWAALFTGIKTVVTVHDNSDRILKISPSRNKEIKAKLNDIILERAKKVVTVSDYLYQHLPLTVRAKATTIANAYPEYLRNLILPYEERESYFVSFINGFGKRTNAKKAIDAFKIFASQKHYKEIKYHLIGLGTEEASQLYDYAKSINAPLNRIIFHGYLPHPKAMDILRKATLLIHPSLEEANCISIIEALVLGVPVLGSDQSPGVIEQLNNGRGFLCNTRRPRDIYELVMSCMKDKDLLAATATRGQKDAFVRYRMESVLEKYSELCF